MLLKNKFFLVTTVIFLLAAVAAIWRIYPPVLSQFREYREKAVQLNEQLEEAESFNQGIIALRNETERLDQIHSLAERALPTTSQSEVLLLELEGLLLDSSLSGARITVPFESAAATGSDAVRPGSGGNAKPIVKGSAATNTSFTLSGDISFEASRLLLDRLGSFSRWNKIKSIEITRNSDSYSTTIVADFFTKPAPSAASATAPSNLLTQATQVFQALSQYSTTPDATTEGSYGKPNPFE